MTDFDKRRDKFQKEMEKLMQKFEIEIYAANVCMPNGEVLPVLKAIDKVVKKDEDKPKK